MMRRRSSGSPTPAPSGLSGRTFQVSTFEALSAPVAIVHRLDRVFRVLRLRQRHVDRFKRSGAGDDRRRRAAVLRAARRAPGSGPAFHALGITCRTARRSSSSATTTGCDDSPRTTAVVGTHITINERPTLVAGVLAARRSTSRRSSRPARASTSSGRRPSKTMRPWGNTLSAIARFKPGVSTGAPRSAELDVARRRDQRRPTPTASRFGARLTPLQEHVSGSIRRPLLVLWGAVGLVLLIVCVNVSNLLLARSATHEPRSSPIRLALGAGRAPPLSTADARRARCSRVSVEPSAFRWRMLLTTLREAEHRLWRCRCSIRPASTASCCSSPLAIGDRHGTRLQRPSGAGGSREPTRRSALIEQSRGTTSGPSPRVGPLVAGGRPSWSSPACSSIGTGLLLRSFVIASRRGFRIPARRETVVMTLTRRSRPDSTNRPRRS